MWRLVRLEPYIRALTPVKWTAPSTDPCGIPKSESREELSEVPLKEADMISLHSTFKIVHINMFVRIEAFSPSVKNTRKQAEGEG